MIVSIIVKSKFRALTILGAALFLLVPAPEVLAQSGSPLQNNLPRSWFRNFDYGIHVDDALKSGVGLYQVVGERLMLIYGPELERAFVLQFNPRVVRPVPKSLITIKGDLEVVLPGAAYQGAQPIPWMQDETKTAVLFYADQKKFKVGRVPPLVGTTNIAEIFNHNPLYKRGMDEYRPNADAVSALKGVTSKAVIEVWFGSWCPHCQQVVPRFLKALQAAGNPNIDVVYHGVPRDFGKYDPARSKNVNGLPTFIFMRNGKEFGRLGGRDTEGVIESRMATLLGSPGTAGGK
jgi:thiol-disulfide isomerase/thioredoxin